MSTMKSLQEVARKPCNRKEDLLIVISYKTYVDVVTTKFAQSIEPFDGLTISVDELSFARSKAHRENKQSAEGWGDA